MLSPKKGFNTVNTKLLFDSNSKKIWIKLIPEKQRNVWKSTVFLQHPSHIPEEEKFKYTATLKIHKTKKAAFH